jgi:hypothetical protein
VPLTDLTPVSWDALWSVEGLVALGTLLLAAGTAGLAVFTSKMASKTAQLAEFTEKEVALAAVAIEADVRPALIGVPVGKFFNDRGERIYVASTSDVRDFHDLATVFVEDVDSHLLISAPLRNEGEGIAFPLAAALHLRDHPGSPWSGEISPTSLPRHEVMRMTFRIASEGDGPTVADVSGVGFFTVLAHYSDLAGNIWSSEMNFELTAGRWDPSEVKLDHLSRTKKVIGGVTLEDA